MPELACPEACLPKGSDINGLKGKRYVEEPSSTLNFISEEHHPLLLSRGQGPSFRFTMVHWSDPAEIAKDADIFQKVIFTLFGVYFWELFMTWDFELSLITKRRKFRWPLGILFSCFSFCAATACFWRSLALTTEVLYSGSATHVSVRSPAVPLDQLPGNMAILCASTSLMLRTFVFEFVCLLPRLNVSFSSIALWERKLSVIITLGIICLAHWTLLYRTMFIVTAQWEPAYQALRSPPPFFSFNVDNTDSCDVTLLAMGFDLIILIFTAVALLGRHSARTDLWKLLFQDGLVYFLVSFSTNCIPAVLNVLDLNRLPP
ncbi:uncharacterized protein LACBIDRAFT_321968 [Laccaria bicolor S238N-H82]|uniref:Predicted protein n=1 Tax=Laccaria bicolor (strain S238N-H82 / ATCC MYA-4686) TaxID=486041 RepID=B0CUT2_LACBS|nr:uncharacterized protein LACBIDRAFT_321968 [Laccaria bicolor S238N-H82]EDR14152.1 predicted protein [Laccaria bicolor S238N-H82]|eukprot:XP_001874711.1 predicted protein [Laccaria bicolor S238N-H82]